MKKILSKILVLVLCAIACVGFTACGGGDYVNAKINVKLYNGDKEAVTMTLSKEWIFLQEICLLLKR